MVVYKVAVLVQMLMEDQHILILGFQKSLPIRILSMKQHNKLPIKLPIKQPNKQPNKPQLRKMLIG